MKTERPVLSRRDFFKSIAGIAASTMMLPSIAKAAVPLARSLSLVNDNTKEKLNITYWKNGRYDVPALARLSWLMRDHHQNRAIPVHYRLADYLFVLQRITGTRAPLHILSGYRTHITNASLGAAEKSYHMRGMAADVRLDDVSVTTLRPHLEKLKIGGVGYHPGQNFLHLDVGPYRRW